jgi:methyl coenzyme M reductase gamma subunit
MKRVGTFAELLYFYSNVLNKRRNEMNDERLAILRRIAEKGLSKAQGDGSGEKYLDLWQHMLDEIQKHETEIDDVIEDIHYGYAEQDE